MRISSRRGTIAFFIILGIGLVALAVALNVGWIILNRSSGYLRELREQFPSSLVFSVTPDQHEIGSIQGRQFKLLLPEGGELFYLRGPGMTSSAQRRAPSTGASTRRGG